LLRSPFIRLLVCLFVFGLAGMASAGQKVDIYRAETLVKSQSEAERNAAARASFGEVIVRVSGQRNALDNPVIKQALPKAQNYLFGFSYKSSTEKITIDGKTVPAIGLQLNYEPQAIEQLLRQAQLPLWPATRPKVLVWLVAKEPTGLRLVPTPADLQSLQLQAVYRGLPLSFPKLDAEGGISLTAGDLWAFDVEKIKAASLRYKADAILVGRYTPYSLGPIPPALDPSTAEELTAMASSSEADAVVDAASAPMIQGPWVGNWQLLHASNTQAFADETPDVKGLFALAVDRATDYFANQYAIVPTNQGAQTIMLRIGNITSFGEFKQAQAYLDDLAMVERMEVVKVSNDGMLVRLTTQGDVKLLVSTLALGRRLAPLQSNAAGATPALVANEASADQGIDANALAELDQALANEKLPGTTPPLPAAVSAPVLGGTPYGGTAENPLMYVWQK